MVKVKIWSIIFFCMLGLHIPTYAHAYLDPSTGNALVYIIVSLFGTLVYFLKEAFYRIMGKQKKPSSTEEHDKILIFSEGKQYWLTFKPIIEALISKNTPFTYICTDVKDPALTIENEYMQSRYLGTGSAAYAKASLYKAHVMLATTPNIGTENFPMKRPSKVQCLAHVFHAVGDIGSYRKGSLDHYDAALLVGDYMLANIRKLESLRGTKQKECISLGLPYLDALLQNVNTEKSKNETPVILVAPSWGEMSCINNHGMDFIKNIGEKYELIVRPHPQSLRVEQDMIAQLEAILSSYPNASLDTNVDASESFQKADVLISDISGVRFDFAFLYEKPVITLNTPITTPEIFELDDTKSCWEQEIAPKLGIVINKEDFSSDSLMAAIEETLRMPSQNLRDLRDQLVTNYGCSADAIAEWVIQKSQKA